MANANANAITTTSFTQKRAPTTTTQILQETPSVFMVCSRSKNKNMVVYEANVQADGTLHPDYPLVGYWLILEPSYQQERKEPHDREELSWIDTFAWGFSTERLTPTTASFTFRQFPDLSFRVHLNSKGNARAVVMWRQRRYMVRSMYIHCDLNIHWLQPWNSGFTLHKLIFNGLDVTDKGNYKPATLTFHERPSINDTQVR